MAFIAINTVMQESIVLMMMKSSAEVVAVFLSFAAANLMKRFDRPSPKERRYAISYSVYELVSASEFQMVCRYLRKQPGKAARLREQHRHGSAHGGKDEDGTDSICVSHGSKSSCYREQNDNHRSQQLLPALYGKPGCEVKHIACAFKLVRADAYVG